MISKKERKIQRALGTVDSMPPTIYELIRNWTARWWLYHITIYKPTFWQWLAFKLPKKLVYHCTIRVWAHATTCPDGRTEIVHETTVDNALTRWEKING
ncbi:MAG: hypothetical protein U9R15_01255 [Chloroflexota bacterium]|nr:hypothetical protein [Chloroflexota bacterium]